MALRTELPVTDDARAAVGRRAIGALGRAGVAVVGYGVVLGVGVAARVGWLVWVLAVGFVGVAAVVVAAGREWDAARRARRVLAVYPWVETVARTGRGRDRRIGKYGSTVTGVALRRGGSGDGAWMPLMSVVNGKAEEILPGPEGPEGHEGTVWFAGDLRFGGVVSPPGGQRPLLLRRQEFGAEGERRMAGTAEDDARAREAGLWGWQRGVR
jgi:hypothetical protein